jgi:hypothetical protein
MFLHPATAKKNNAARSPQSILAFLTALFSLFCSSAPAGLVNPGTPGTLKNLGQISRTSKKIPAFFQRPSVKDSEKISFGQGSFIRKQACPG